MGEKFVLRNDLEKRLERMEDRFSKALDAVLDPRARASRHRVEDEDKLALAMLAANLVLRNPRYMPNFVNEPVDAGTRAELDLIREDAEAECAKRGWLLDFGALVEAGEKRGLLVLDDGRAPHAAVARAVYGMDLAILEAPSDHLFVTSSFPVLASTEPDDAGIETPVSLYIPLSSRYAALFSPAGEGYADQTIRGDDVEKFNSCYLPANNPFVEWILAESEEALARLSSDLS